MEFNERKKKILEVIIRDYINTAEPVGSRTLSKRYDLGISPATIRNEMADLEDLGFLVQPHTSSGRVPTQKAYRFYVDEVMEIGKLARAVRNDIHRGYLNVSTELENTMAHTASLLSTLTNYTAVVMSPRGSFANLKHVQLVPLIRDRVLMILVSREGIATEVELTLSEEIDASEALRLSNVINTMLGQASFMDLGETLLDRFEALRPVERRLLSEVIRELKAVVKTKNSEVQAKGVTNLLAYPEFNDVGKIRQLVEVIEEKSILTDILSEDSGNQIIRITIGNENDNENLKEFSIVTTTYELGGEIMGAFGIFGPTRMNYDKVTSVMGTIRDELSANLSKLLE